MATGSATISAKTGPGLQATLAKLKDVTRFDLDLPKSTLTIYYGAGQIATFDIVGVTLSTNVITQLINTFVVS